MAVERVLVTVKTYPCLSQKYDELVCTAGLREDGSWIRIYPVPFRKLNPYSQYKKYDWIEVESQYYRFCYQASRAGVGCQEAGAGEG